MDSAAHHGRRRGSRVDIRCLVARNEPSHLSENVRHGGDGRRMHLTRVLLRERADEPFVQRAVEEAVLEVVRDFEWIVRRCAEVPHLSVCHARRFYKPQVLCVFFVSRDGMSCHVL